jgi:ceramide glucosyltransferase
MLWYNCEALLAHTAGWPLSKRSPLAWIARDLLLPAIWINAWLADEFVWRGNAVRSRDGGPRLARAARQWLARQTPT